MALPRFRPMALGSLCLLAAPLAFAQQSEQPSDETDLTLNPIVVTSTLSTETANESLSSVTVIDRETIDRQRPAELIDLLEGQPGMDVVPQGGFGKQTSIFTRGAGSQSTVLLLDGIRLDSPADGGAPWPYVPPQFLDRVEIVRGANSSLHGADAMGGVVQGFTTSESSGAWVEAGRGSFNTDQLGAGVRGQSGGTRYSFQGNHFETDGTRVREGGEDKGFRNSAGSLSVQHDFDDGSSLGVVGLRSQGNTEFVGGETDYLLQSLGVKGSTLLTDWWTLTGTVSEMRLDTDNDRSFGESQIDARQRTGRLENKLGTDRAELILGGEYTDIQLDTFLETSNPQRYAQEDRYNRALFAQGTLQRDHADLRVNVRWDDDEYFGDKTTARVALGSWLDSYHRVRVSYGTAYRTPSFDDLFFPGASNPELQPETSQTAEIGFRGAYQTMFWDLTFFEFHADDLIQFDVGAGEPRNVANARTQGMEAQLGVNRGKLDLSSTLTLKDPRDRETSNRLVRRTTRSLRVDADYTDGRLSFGGSLIAEGDRYDDADNENRLPGFATANLRVGVDLSERLSLSFRMNNVFDREYSRTGAGFDPVTFAPFDYLAPGRNVFVSLRYGAK